MKKALLTGILLAWSVTGHAVATEPATPEDVIARVGDQTITFGQLNTMLNSSAVVGVSIPALGTPKRDTVRITLLDKVISANLLYLDALDQGLEQHPAYRDKIEGFRRAMLVDLFYRRNLVDDVVVTDQDIEDFYAEHGAADATLNDESRAQIEAMIRTQRFKARKEALRDRLRAGADIEIMVTNLQPGGDNDRPADTPVARYNGGVISWGEVKAPLMAAGQAATRDNPLAMEENARIRALEGMIDKRLMADLAREQGLDTDPVFQNRVREYGKTSLINLHRAELAERFEPDQATLQAYYEDNRRDIMIPAARKVQEVVLETREQAEAIREKLVAGEMTMWEAASEHSIAPGAEKDLGEIGWVKEKRALPVLNDVIFSLNADQISEPVPSPVGWHLLRVMDVREARFDDLEHPDTRARVRRTYIHDKLDDYVVNLRKNEYPVELYEERIIRLSQKEADMVDELSRQAQEDGSVTQKRVQELRKLMDNQSE